MNLFKQSYIVFVLSIMLIIINFMYLDSHCFSNALTFSSISFFIVTSLIIIVILIRVSETSFSLASFVN